MDSHARLEVTDKQPMIVCIRVTSVSNAPADSDTPDEGRKGSQGQKCVGKPIGRYTYEPLFFVLRPSVASVMDG